MTERRTGGERRARMWSACLVLAGTVLLSLQGGLLRVALPVIRSDLSTGVAGIQAVSLAGLAVVTATLVAFGRIADVAGPRRLYAGGLAAFAAGAALSAAASSAAWMVVAQAVQGVGWSMYAGSAPVILVRAFLPAERGRILAANHMAVAVGLAAGPGAGGLVVEHLGWRAGFAALVPAALLLAALVATRLPREAGGGERPSFDLTGSALLAAALTGVLVMFGRGDPGSLAGPGAPALLLGTLLAFGLFGLRQARSPDPLVDLRLFANPRFSAGLAASFLNFIAMASNMFLMPFLLQDHLGLDAARAGLVIMVVSIVIVLAAPAAGAMADRAGPRLPATLGLGLITASIVLMAAVRQGTSVPRVVAVLAVYGLGAAFFQTPNASGVLGAVPPGRLGVASGTLSTMGRLGQMAGVAIAGGAWQAGLDRYGASGQGAGWAFRDAFLVLAAFGLLATAASWLRGRETPARPAAGLGAAGEHGLP